MKKLNFLNEYYQNRSLDQNISYLLNMYLEEDKSNGKYPVVAYPTPGKTTFNTGTGSVVRCMFEHNGVAYAVVDTVLYSYSSSGTRTSKGTLNTSTGRVLYAAISNQIMLVDSGDGYIYNTDTSSFSAISDADFPSTPYALTAQDSTFLVSSSGTAVVYGSDVADGTSWSALSFNTKETQGDDVVALMASKGLIYVLGEYESDVWYNSGAATFSFEPVGLGAKFNYGCAARFSVAKGRDTIVYLGQSRTGGKEVVMMDQYTPKVISSRAITYQINQLTTWSDAFAYCYNKSGHEFYVLTFPTDAKTFMFDFSTGLWSELNSYISAAYTREISNCYCYCYNKHLIGAYNSAYIYSLDDTVYQENGVNIKKQIICPPGYADGTKIYIPKLQIDVQTNVGSSLSCTVDVSKDTGQTYPLSFTGTIPSTGGRMFFSRLGMTQNAFVIRMTSTSNSKFVVLGALADIEIGAH